MEISTTPYKVDKNEYTYERDYNRENLVMSALKYKSVHDLIRDRVKLANKLVAEYEKTNEYKPKQAPTKIRSQHSPYLTVPSIFDEALYKWRSSAGFFDDPPSITDDDDQEDNNEFDEMSEKLLSKMRELDESLEYDPDPEYEKSAQLPIGLAQIKEEEKGPFFDEILSFLSPILKNRFPVQGGMEGAVNTIKQYIDEHSDEKNHLIQFMNVKRLMIPYISLNLTARAILCYNQLEEDDPLVPMFRTHPTIGEEIKKFGVFLDRFDTHKEVICSFVWSKVDNTMVSLPVVGLNPYPMCFTCRKAFGEKTCSKCGVFKYCSKNCQVKGWKMHRFSCPEIQKITEEFKVLEFE